MKLMKLHRIIRVISRDGKSSNNSVAIDHDIGTVDVSFYSLEDV